MTTIIGIDIGGTKTYGALFESETLSLIREITIATDAYHTKEVLLEAWGTLLTQLRREDTIGVGIAFAGMVSTHEGKVIRAANIPSMDGVELCQILSEACGLHVVMDNDALLFTLAEAHLGAGKDKNPVLGFTFGTGVGGGLIINTHPYTGQHGIGMEPGHMLLCGEDSTIEFEKRYGLQGWYHYIQKYTGKEAPKHFQEAYPTWDKATQDLFTPRVKELGRFFANMTLLLNPQVIILGGGVGRYLFPLLLPHITTEVYTLLQEHQYPQRPFFRIGTLPNGGALGATLLWKHRIYSR